MSDLLLGLDPKRTSDARSTKNHPVSFRNVDGRQRGQTSLGTQSHTTPKSTLPSTLSTIQNTCASNQRRGKVQQALRERRWSFFCLTQTTAVDPTLNRRTLLSQNHPTNLRPLFQKSFKMSNPRNKEIHSAAEVPNRELKVHRRVTGSGAHASNPEDGQVIEQQEQAPARDEEETAKVGWDGDKVQQHTAQGKHKSQIHRRTQRGAKANTRVNSRPDKWKTKTSAGQRKTSRPNYGLKSLTWSLRWECISFRLTCFILHMVK